MSFVVSGCGGGFTVLSLGGSQAGISELSPEQAKVAEGTRLYASSCVSCHGDLGVSVKRGKTPAEINSALQSVSSMRSFSLTTAQVEAISAALNAASTVTLPGGVSLKYACSTPSARGVGDSRMARLKKTELVNTLSDLLGSSIVSDNAIQTQFGVIAADVMELSPKDIGQSHADSHVEAMMKISIAAADLSLANATNRDRIYGTCAGVATVTEDCAKKFVESFGLKVLRRPLLASETSDYLDYFKVSGGTEGLKRVLMRLLLSPTLAFHIESNGTSQGSRIRLSDYEIASRISYRIAGTMPDAALFQAAAAGELQSLANVETHVRRMLNNNALAKSRLNEFFAYYMQFRTYGSPNPIVGTANGIDVNGLRDEMLTETTDFLNNVVWTKKGKFKDLFTSREVFPRSARMAKILETTQASGATPVLTTAAHAGILFRPGFLATSADRTNPMHRGALIRKRILCDTLGAPDPVAVNSRLNELGDLSDMTNRTRYLTMTNVPACLGCHNSINPVGFVMEGYDQLGMRRSSESIFNNDGTLAKTKTIDLRIENPQIEPGGPESLMDGLSLNDAMANGNKARSCFTKLVFEFQKTREATEADNCALNDVETTSATTGTLLDSFVRGVANEDIFWKGL